MNPENLDVEGRRQERPEGQKAMFHG